MLVSKLLSRTTKIRVNKMSERTLRLKEEHEFISDGMENISTDSGTNQKRIFWTWRARFNGESDAECMAENVIKDRLGHEERIGEDQTAKSAYLGQPTGHKGIAKWRSWMCPNGRGWHKSERNGVLLCWKPRSTLAHWGRDVSSSVWVILLLPNQKYCV